eukprot:793070-Pleurochrysis_carterae.AAC.1
MGGQRRDGGAGDVATPGAGVETMADEACRKARAAQARAARAWRPVRGPARLRAHVRRASTYTPRTPARHS